jgi:RsiW-degrading membrane proteinase PrsW (M82 family)
MGGLTICCPTCRERVDVPQPSKAVAKPPPKIDTGLKMADHFDAKDFEEPHIPGRIKTGEMGQVGGMIPLPPTRDEVSAPLNRLEKKKTLRGSLYFVFLLAFVPLAYDVAKGNEDSPIARLEKAIDELHGDQRARARAILEAAKEGTASLDDIFDFLPNKMVKGAWLPRDSDLHYTLGGVVAVLFMFLFGICIPKGFHRFILMMIIAAFTGTFGITILLITQFLAMFGVGLLMAGPFGIIIWMIGLAYRLILNPDMPFLPTFLGYTFGVGLCEEIIKALPIFFIFMGRKRLRWHECLSLGMASGAGFGIAEGIHYSGMMYNGLFGMDTYFVRFFSCVMLHAVWCGAAALFLHRFQRITHGRLSFWDAFCRMVLLVAIPMVLHGLYNTLLTKNIDGLALTVALFSFGWLVLMIETARDKEGDILVEVRNDIEQGTPLHQPAPVPVAEQYQPVMMPAGLE